MFNDQSGNRKKNAMKSQFVPVPTRSASFQTMLKSFQRILTGTNSGDERRVFGRTRMARVPK
jgi:hypothetical protein